MGFGVRRVWYPLSASLGCAGQPYGVTKTGWLLHLADICQLFSNRTVFQLLGM